jgi:hypothetical protein
MNHPGSRSDPEVTPCVTYRAGYKYQLRATHVDQTEIRPAEAIVTEYVRLDPDGTITLRDGYAWDGASGPTRDTPSFMRASLVHDALYQLMRLEQLDRERWRETADEGLRSMCREDGMHPIRAWWVFQAVRLFGDPLASPERRRPLRTAPEECRPVEPSPANE